MKRLYRPWLRRFEDYTFAAFHPDRREEWRLEPAAWQSTDAGACMTTEELETLILNIQEEGYTSPQHTDVLRQAEAKLIERKKEAN
jgi:hypothetical protein